MPETQLINQNVGSQSETPDFATLPSKVQETGLQGAEPQLTEAENTNILSDSGYAVLKCFFCSSQKGDISGAFSLVFEGETGRELFRYFWVARLSQSKSLSVSLNWRDFNRDIPQIGYYDKYLGDKLLSIFPEVLPEAELIDLFQHEELGNKFYMDFLNDKIRKQYERHTRCFLEVFCELQLLSKKELVEAGLVADDSDTQGAELAETDETGEPKRTYIQCLPIVDPVRGTAASDLHLGDLIEVKIKSTTGAGGLLKNFLESTQQLPVFPVDGVEKGQDDKIYIYLRISKELRGLLTLTKDLRLKTRSSSSEKTKKKFLWENIIFLGTLLIAFVVVLWVVRYLFF